MMNRRTLGLLILVVGLILFVDELWMFGLPIGGFLGDWSAHHVSFLHVEFHHWMWGVALMVIGGAMLR